MRGSSSSTAWNVRSGSTARAGEDVSATAHFHAATPIGLRDASVVTFLNQAIEGSRLRHSFQMVLTRVLEHEAGACDELLHGGGREDLGRAGLSGDAGSDHDRESTVLAVDQLALPGVDAGADLEAERAHRLDDRRSAPDRPGGSVER